MTQRMRSTVTKFRKDIVVCLIRYDTIENNSTYQWEENRIYLCPRTDVALKERKTNGKAI